MTIGMQEMVKTVIRSREGPEGKRGEHQSINKFTRQNFACATSLKSFIFRLFQRRFR